METLKNFKRNILFLCLIAFISGSFQGCSFIQTKNPKVSELVQNIKKISNLSSMQEGDKTKLRKLYSINVKILEEFTLYAPKTNMEANELLILKVKNQDDIDELQETIEKRIEKQSNSFKDYKPDQYDLLENHILKIKGKYIIFVVSKDVDKIAKSINDSFK